MKNFFVLDFSKFDESKIKIIRNQILHDGVLGILSHYKEASISHSDLAAPPSNIAQFYYIDDSGFKYYINRAIVTDHCHKTIKTIFSF
ncbi:hypothetical protein [Bacillus massiliigorillae]|uniref:hypothetical protein n=1 Tax=Bacillus massiliigorillae TaxID=1243664 RepID=UPI0012B5DA50|nr:hypothetical protein [Bacillus massiliigorillae]